MGRVLIAAVAGGVVLFVWGAISWMALPWHETHGFALTNEEQVVEALAAGNNEAGLYWIPGMPQGTDQEAWATRHRAGPVGMLVYDPAGSEPMAPMMFVRGIVIDVVAALVAAILLALGTGRRGYIGRVAIVALLGVLIAIAADATYWNFAGFPDDFTLVAVADRIIGWFAVGLVMAAIVKPKPKVVEVT